MLLTEYKYSPVKLEEYAIKHVYNYTTLMREYIIYKFELLVKWERWKKKMKATKEDREEAQLRIINYILEEALSCKERDILEMYLRGVKVYDIAMYYGVHRATVYRQLENINDKIKGELEIN
jgi:DNA-binding CsgD family transcriptional regulator